LVAANKHHYAKRAQLKGKLVEKLLAKRQPKFIELMR
jgi:hypothetical protein